MAKKLSNLILWHSNFISLTLLWGRFTPHTLTPCQSSHYSVTPPLFPSSHSAEGNAASPPASPESLNCELLTCIHVYYMTNIYSVIYISIVLYTCVALITNFLMWWQGWWNVHYTCIYHTWSHREARTYAMCISIRIISAHGMFYD